MGKNATILGCSGWPGACELPALRVRWQLGTVGVVDRLRCPGSRFSSRNSATWHTDAGRSVLGLVSSQEQQTMRWLADNRQSPNGAARIFGRGGNLLR